MKIYQYLRLHIKIICRRFRIITLLPFEIHAPAIYEMFVYKHTGTIEYVKIWPIFQEKYKLHR